MMMMMMCKH